MRLKREMSTTSSQDEFARWAKLRRQHDKVTAEYEAICTTAAQAATPGPLVARMID